MLFAESWVGKMRIVAILGYLVVYSVHSNNGQSWQKWEFWVFAVLRIIVYMNIMIFIFNKIVIQTEWWKFCSFIYSVLYAVLYFWILKLCGLILYCLCSSLDFWLRFFDWKYGKKASFRSILSSVRAVLLKIFRYLFFLKKSPCW